MSKNYYHTRIVPNEAALGPATVTLITQFRWMRVALVSEDTPAFKQVVSIYDLYKLSVLTLKVHDGFIFEPHR